MTKARAEQLRPKIAAAIETATAVLPKTYRLGSNEMVHTPGIVAWAVNGAAFKRDLPKMVEIIASYGVPTEAARALVTKKVPYKVEGDAVVFTA